MHKTLEDISHPVRATTIKTVLDLSCDDGREWPLDDIVSDLWDALLSIPKQYRHGAMFRITAHGEYASARAIVEFRRPETKEEFAERKLWLDNNQQEREERDRREFERLKAKFG